MTRLLQNAFAEAAKLPVAEQDALAAAVLSEIEFERQWDRLFAGSDDVLSDLAGEALAEHRAGRTKRLEPDRL